MSATMCYWATTDDRIVLVVNALPRGGIGFSFVFGILNITPAVNRRNLTLALLHARLAQVPLLHHDYIAYRAHGIGGISEANPNAEISSGSRYSTKLFWRR